ncbi:MAG: DUF2723 domain-containing protein [Chloroflexi bacterium]|nr:DUF2723 domain-containing protein [Chloroflexota bacterium]
MSDGREDELIYEPFDDEPVYYELDERAGTHPADNDLDDQALADEEELHDPDPRVRRAVRTSHQKRRIGGMLAGGRRLTWGSVSRLPRVIEPTIGPITLLVLLVVYVTTLQTHIAGSFNPDLPGGYLRNEYIKDVGEIQVALNVWGTIHHTGYPLYAILGNLFTAGLRVLAVEPAYAASLYALAWGMLALGGLGFLIWRWTGRVSLALVSVALLGLTRSIWIHNVLAEVYSMSLAISVLLLLVVLWPLHNETASAARRRLLLLALLGGIGVAHHRAVAFFAPGLLVAAWRLVWLVRARWWWTLLGMVGLALVGFVPYAYLPLNAWYGGEWVYGEPDTWDGFWTEFTGREADRLVTLPDGLDGWRSNAQAVWDILATELTLPGLLAGLVCLALACIVTPQRYAACIVTLCAAGPALFALAYHTAVLPEAILMPVVMALVVGVALTIDWLARLRSPFPALSTVAMLAMVGWVGALVHAHHAFVRELVTEPTGLQTIERIRHVPRDGQPALMLPWGPRYSAAAYSRLVTEENADLLLVDHKGDYEELLDSGYQLYTEWETFYTYPLPWPNALNPNPDNTSTWWPERLGWDGRLGRFHITSAAPGLVQLSNTLPELLETPDPVGWRDPELLVLFGVSRYDAWLTCDEVSIYLHVIWMAEDIPQQNPSIYVHLTGDELAPNPPNADSRYPVYGLYPFTEWWGPAQLVRDDFTLPRLPDRTLVRFGLYDPAAPAVKIGERVLPVAECQPAAWAE